MRVLTPEQFAILTVGSDRDEDAEPELIELLELGLVERATPDPDYNEAFDTSVRGDVAARAHLAWLAAGCPKSSTEGT